VKPRILVLADVPGWAWERKGRAYLRHLGAQFDLTLAFHADRTDFGAYDLVHLFEVLQIAHIQAYGAARPFKVVAGLTANVWRTWGADRMHAWAKQVDAMHGNSRLIEADLKPFHPRVYYTPNGVEPDTYRRLSPRQEPRVIFGHVGKPNPRKGGDLIVQAARAAHVDLRLIQRTSKLALAEAQMIEWYQPISVMVTASNMDGTPNPMLEGAACECALLSTPIGNMPEFIQRDGSGYLTTNRLPYPPPGPDDDPAKVALDRERLQWELTESMRVMARQPEITWKMGRRAREAVLYGWTWAQQVEHVARMWWEVLGE
jgi:glycosyltransferase involved in cell wall biosynthesis